MSRKILKFIKNNLHKLNGLDILVVGDVGIDRYLHLKVIKDSPEAPGKPVVKLQKVVTAAGMAANVANNVSAINNKCMLRTVTDNAYYSSYEIKKNLALGVNYKALEDYNRRRTVKTRYMINGEQALRWDKEDIFPIPVQLESRLVKEIKGSNARSIILSDYQKGVLTPNVLDGIVGDGITVLDAHERSIVDLPYTVLKLNEPTLHKIAERSPLNIRAEYLVITKGARGLLVGNEIIPAFSKNAVDVTGAGDSVTAGIGTALAAGWSVLEGCYLGSLMAAVTVQKPGTASANPEEIEKLIKELLK